MEESEEKARLRLKSTREAAEHFFLGVFGMMLL
jgi:hypothetical protein